MKAVAELLKGFALGIAIAAGVLVTLYLIAWFIWVY